MMTKLTGSSATAAARQRSIAEAQERIRQERLEEDARYDSCRCGPPVPGRVYLGNRLCSVCQRFIP